MLEKARQPMSRSSRSLYMFERNRNFCRSVCWSLASPVRPTMTLSLIWKTFCISQPTVWFRMPYRRSLAIAMQSLPAIAITAAPLYCMIDDIAPAAGWGRGGRVGRGKREGRGVRRLPRAGAGDVL